MTETKRLFFGFEAQAPWPEEYPRGRLLDPAHRHMTLAFLGNVDYQQVADLLPQLPKPSLKVGLAGRFDNYLFLPPHRRQPHVHAWHVDWIDDPQPLLEYQKQLSDWLREKGFHIDKRDFLPHVTICRAPFYPREWKHAFASLPCVFKDIHLYESVGNLKYEPRWSHRLAAPFEEIEHTADIAFRVRGETLQQLHRHAQIALAFRHPQLLPFLTAKEIASLHESIQDLNDTVCRADADAGCPFKAVSYHGDIKTTSEGILEWEMIVDV